MTQIKFQINKRIGYVDADLAKENLIGYVVGIVSSFGGVEIWTYVLP